MTQRPRPTTRQEREDRITQEEAEAVRTWNQTVASGAKVRIWYYGRWIETKTTGAAFLDLRSDGLRCASVYVQVWAWPVRLYLLEVL